MSLRARCLLLAFAWFLLTPVLPHLHAHELGTGSADTVTGLHAPWAHDVPGPADAEFIAEVEDPRLWSLVGVSVQPALRLRSAEISRPLPWFVAPSSRSHGPPASSPQSPQAP